MKIDIDDDGLSISYNSIPTTKGQMIGKGSFGEVYKEVYNGTEVAVKVINIEAAGIHADTAVSEIQALRYIIVK